MSSKYGKVPEQPSAEGQWLKFSLEVQVENYETDWRGVDTRTLTQQLGYIIGLTSAGSTLHDDDDETLNVKPARILARNLTVEEIEFIEDSLIAKFLDDQG